MFDGVEKVPVEGKTFIYEGSTYVPLRFVSEALGKPVEWDETNEMIWIGSRSNYLSVQLAILFKSFSEKELPNLIEKIDLSQ